jgi:hypothetical protein
VLCNLSTSFLLLDVAQPFNTSSLAVRSGKTGQIHTRLQSVPVRCSRACSRAGAASPDSPSAVARIPHCTTALAPVPAHEPLFMQAGVRESTLLHRAFSYCSPVQLQLSQQSNGTEPDRF